MWHFHAVPVHSETDYSITFISRRSVAMFQFKFCILHLIAEKDYSGTVLTRVFFYKKMYGRFAGRPNKSGLNNEVTVLPTEVAIRQQGFHFQS